MPIAGPFYFAWVDASDKTWNSSTHLVMDEYIFSIRRSLIEAEKPLLELEIKNPRTGLLNPLRRVWAWVSYNDGSGAQPFFFGRLVGNPMELFHETITIQLIADPRNYRHQKQMIAETKKVIPWWDPVFIDVIQRDDPDKILEAYGELWDVDPVTHVVSAVGIADGPDGNIDLDEDEHLYDNMETTVGEPPATVIRMDATVPWTQSARGTVNMGVKVISTLTDAIRSEWPQPLTQIGDGWSVFDGLAVVTNGADAAMAISYSDTWTSSSKKHSNGDTLSDSYSQTKAMGPLFTTRKLTEQTQSGVIDPYAVDEDGDPSPLNIPSTYAATSASVVQYVIATSLVLEYIAERPRTERVIFTVKADTQPILVDAQVEQTSENITVVGADVSAPIAVVLNWTSVSNGIHVDVGQVIFPDNPKMPGGQTAQIAVVAGNTGDETPDFSDIPGFTTIDGTVTWSSLGVSEPPTQTGDWQKGQHYNLGDMITPRRPRFATMSSLTAPGANMFPPQGTSFSEGTYIQNTGGGYSYVSESGVLSPNGTNTATFVNLARLPSGSATFICVQAGTTSAVLPVFNETIGTTTIDNSVIWNCVVGTASSSSEIFLTTPFTEIPIGGTPGQIHAPSYFSLARGQRSLEYLGLLVRAKLLWRARCVDISFDVDWNTGRAMTTRKTVTMHDPRIAGGVALGKVKSAIMSFSDRGEAVCRVTIACLVGRDNAIADDPGTPTYVEEGYVAGGYQKLDAQIVLLPTGSDIAYTPLAYTSSDDGLVFPLDYGQITVKDQIREPNGAMEGAVMSALTSMAEAAKGTWNQRNGIPGPPMDPFQMKWDEAKTEMLKSGNSVQAAIAEHPRFVDYEIKPVNSGPFHAVFNVEFSNLTIAKGIDLLSEIEG